MRPLLVLPMALLVCGAVSSARSADSHALASAWVASEYAQIRLISGVTGVGHGATIPLGVQIKLSPEWKTYWRTPGETGIPPRFNWTASQNMQAAEVHWPGPHRYRSFGLDTIGYKHEVVFPVTAQVSSPGQSVTVSAVIDYAVCRDICVPLQARLSLEIPEGADTKSAHGPLLKRFRDQVPVTPIEGENADTPVLLELRRLDEAGSDKLLAVVKRLPSVGQVDVFVEAGDGFGFGPPEVFRHPDSGRISFEIPIQRYLKKADLSANSVVLTIVAGTSAFEFSGTLGVD